MISEKLKLIILLSIPVFIIHGIEEYINRFYDVFPLHSLTWAPQLFQTIPQTAFLAFQVTWWLLLVVAFLLISGRKGTKIVLVIYGIVMIYELTHILHTLVTGKYIAGFYTSLLFPFLNYFYWKELLKNFKRI